MYLFIFLKLTEFKNKYASTEKTLNMILNLNQSMMNDNKFLKQQIYKQRF